MIIRDHGNHIRVLLNFCYATLTGLGGILLRFKFFGGYSECPEDVFLVILYPNEKLLFLEEFQAR